MLASSDLDIDTYFVNAIREAHGVDVKAAAEGPEPQTIGVWVDPEVTERRRGMAFCAPVNPGAEERGRAFIAEAFAKPEMTESRRALGQSVEVVTQIASPEGTVVGVYLEGVDPSRATGGSP